MNTYTRGSYNEIVLRTLSPELREEVEALVKRVGSDQTDEHGSWDFGIVSDRKLRGEALNWDLYAVGNDIHSGKLLAVVQVRKTIFHPRRYSEVRKNYFLIGTNEDDTVFAHSVSANVIHAAIRADKDVILAVQNWIFGGDYNRMIRQGDLALLPVTKAVGEKTSKRKMEIEGSHTLTANAIRENGSVYAKNPTLVHQPGTHPTISGEGWYKVIVGKRAPFWPFARPTAD